MRKASMVLGLVGGTIAILVALLIISGAIAFNTANNMIDDESISTEFVSEDFPDIENQLDMAGKIFSGFGVAILIAGLLGIIGGGIVKKNNIIAGILMLLGSLISLFTLWAFVSFILLLLGGIFALVNDNSNQQSDYQNQNIESKYNDTFSV